MLDSEKVKLFVAVKKTVYIYIYFFFFFLKSFFLTYVFSSHFLGYLSLNSNISIKSCKVFKSGSTTLGLEFGFNIFQI